MNSKRIIILTSSGPVDLARFTLNDDGTVTSEWLEPLFQRSIENGIVLGNARYTPANGVEFFNILDRAFANNSMIAVINEDNIPGSLSKMIHLVAAEKLLDLMKSMNSPELQSRGEEIVEESPRLQNLKNEIGNKLPGGYTFEQHVAMGSDAIVHHKIFFGKIRADINNLVLPGSRVESRIKDITSAISKLHRKPDYNTVSKLQDITGFLIVVKNIDQLFETVKRIKGKFEIITEDDYITHPKEYYRAYHLIIRDRDNLPKEIQVQTENQYLVSNWAHDTYKPRKNDQKEALERHRSEIDKYVKDVSDYFAEKDAGRKPNEKPECPAVVRREFSSILKSI